MTGKPTPLRIETKLVHAGEPRPRLSGAVTMPIFQSSTFSYGGESSYHEVRYIRLNNTPNHIALHDKLSAIEGGESAIVTSSGMAAISTTLLALLKTGDHLLIQQDLYGGTFGFVTKDLPRFGIEHTLIDANDPASWQDAIRPSTKAIYVESISNPLVRVGDLKGIVAFAKDHHLISMVDNTFATPINFRPLEHGFDLSLHSCTKYLNGHTDLVAGAVIGRASLIDDIKKSLDHLGGTLDPHVCFLLQRGLKTLALRVRYQNQSALQLARWLEAHPAVKTVHYPGLERHPNHARARNLFAGCGGMLSVELKAGLSAAESMIDRLTLPVHAPSLGGVETLVTRPATTSHAGLSQDERRRQGIEDGLVRISVGLEATDDLMADFDQALDQVDS